jgi:hypothetical protein
LGAGHSGGY